MYDIVAVLIVSLLSIFFLYVRRQRTIFVAVPLRNDTRGYESDVTTRSGTDIDRQESLPVPRNERYILTALLNKS
jgi:hypothetical protein